MSKRDFVYVCVWSGDAKSALDLVAGRYPAGKITEVPHRSLRVSRFGERIRLLRGFQGRAMIFCFPSLERFKHRQIVEYFHFLHRCRETVLCDASGRWEPIRNIDILRSAPRVLISLLGDLQTIVFWWSYLKVWQKRAAAPPRINISTPDVAYLIPNPADMGAGGGAISHIRGFLSGVRAAGIHCRVFTGSALAQDAFDNEVIAAGNRPHFFWGAAMLWYNFVFAREVQRRLATGATNVLYQRHFAFSVAGALLSKRMKIPLILEYNGSEAWIAEHWDPNPLRSWIRLCEEATLQSASRIIVVSEVLRDDLIRKGIEADRIRVNPNAVDPEFFYPGRGRTAGRRELGIQPDEVLVGFVGSFSLWHGIEVLQHAITRLLRVASPCRLRFVLMGDGLLQGEMRAALIDHEKTGEVIFTGPLPPGQVAQFLDASDILVSPHIPMPDGSKFFGSPTKLFEYMAMGKAIVASRIGQLGDVLSHDETAWLVAPGSAEDLANAIAYLAADPAKREVLGAAARRAAVERHSWSHNVACALDGQVRDARQFVCSTGRPG